MTLAPRWLRARAGVRVASALAAAAVVALALVVAGVALILLVGKSLSHSVETDAVQSAQAIATRMHGNYGKRVNGSYTPKENAVEALDTLMGRGDPALAQILVDYSDDQDGSGWAVQDGSDNSSLGAMSDLAPPSRQTQVVSSAFVPDKGGTMHAVLVAVGGNTTTSDPMHFVVLYAAPLAAVDAAQDTVMFYLMIGVPILIIVAGAATYVFSGRALRPVEAIRARVASMSEKDLAERVPVPAARDEVGRLAETMNEMIARLEQAQNVQRRFVADASHELRSPLATIGAGLELLHDSDPGTVGALQGETQRLGRLVDDLLLLARADERGLQPRHDEVDLDEIAEAERGRPYDDGVRTEVHAEHVRVVGDRGQLVRVLRNLVDNARRHARSRVVVTLGREGDRAALDVADDGPGVPASDRIRIFERFVRLDDARARSDGGSGLGLAIVAEVVAAHNGRVWVEDAPGGGALFRVRLPAAELPVDEDFEPADLPANGVDRPEPAASGAQVASSPSGNGHPVLANGAPSPAPRPNGVPTPNGNGRPSPTLPLPGRSAAAPNGSTPQASPPLAPVPNGSTPPASTPDGATPRPAVPNGSAPPVSNGSTPPVPAANGSAPPVPAPGASRPYPPAPWPGSASPPQNGAAPVPAWTPGPFGAWRNDAEPQPNEPAPNGGSAGPAAPPLKPRRARRRPILRRPPMPAPATDDPYADWVPPQPPTPTSGRS